MSGVSGGLYLVVSSLSSPLLSLLSCLIFTLYTPIVSVSHKARGTEFTDGLVILHNAGSVAGTDLALAGVCTLEVDAGLVPGAAPVLQTDGD